MVSVAFCNTSQVPLLVTVPAVPADESIVTSPFIRTVPAATTSCAALLRSITSPGEKPREPRLTETGMVHSSVLPSTVNVSFLAPNSRLMPVVSMFRVPPPEKVPPVMVDVDGPPTVSVPASDSVPLVWFRMLMVSVAA